MKVFAKLISYLFHPLLIPVAGTFTYFIITPKYNPLILQGGILLPIFILTVIIPIISFLILKNLGLIRSVYKTEGKEQKYAFYITIILLLMVLIKVLPNNYIIELYYYFVGLIIGASTSLILLIFGFKSSVHLLGMGSLLMYLVSLSIHFEINVIMALSLLILGTGLVCTSRLYLTANSKYEILIGLIIGIISQLITLRFWL